jgi:hypothetical protein
MPWPNTIKIVTERRGKTVGAWVVLINGEVRFTGLTRRQANCTRRELEWWAAPEQRASARERITGG